MNNIKLAPYSGTFNSYKDLVKSRQNEMHNLRHPNIIVPENELNIDMRPFVFSKDITNYDKNYALRICASNNSIPTYSIMNCRLTNILNISNSIIGPYCYIIHQYNNNDEIRRIEIDIMDNFEKNKLNKNLIYINSYKLYKSYFNDENYVSCKLISHSDDSDDGTSSNYNSDSNTIESNEIDQFVNPNYKESDSSDNDSDFYIKSNRKVRYIDNSYPYSDSE